MRSPLATAALWALIYIAICVPYIWFSGQWAEAIASSAEHLKRIEAAKGTLFVLVTGALFFVMSLAVWRRIRANENIIRRQQQSLLASERKVVAGMYAATMAHDLNNLLMCLSALVECLKKPVREEAALARIRHDIETATASLSHLAACVSASAKEVFPDIRVPTPLGATVARVVALARKHPDVRRCAIALFEDHGASPNCNAALLEEALLNLIINAAQAAGPHGHIDIRSARSDGCAVVQIHDDGPGVADHLIPAIFDPCFTTKSAGSGLGLLAVRTFALSHGGSITVGKSPLGGALFELRFPVDPAPVRPAPR